jgi:hypothetical protein
VTSFRDLPPAVQDLYPADIQGLYEIHEWRNATSIAHRQHPQEWDELMTVLRDFRLKRSYILKSGGNKSQIAIALDSSLANFGWKKENFDTTVSVTARLAGETQTYDVPTHEVDCYKNRIALEVEWNNKDPFFDRDLNNFRLLFELRVIDLGIIVTRSDSLKGLLRGLRPGTSYGESTTHMGKALSKLDGGGAGGCPVIAFGITPALYVEDDEPISQAEIVVAELIDTVEALQDEDE